MSCLFLYKLNEKDAVFEDAADGITAARKGNMKAVAIITKYQSAAELKNADIIIKDFSEINLKKLEALF